ncbi:MAG: TRAP transporter large permease [Burkholderiaceae bacterium]
MLATALGILVILLVLSVPVAAVLGVLGLALDAGFSFMPLHRAMGEVIWGASAEYVLIAIPLFVMLGEILLRSGIASRVYAAIAQWISWLPGGLMHANIGTCAMFAATSGSSVATAATVGTVAMPEIERRGYNERLFLGSIAAGGTLGILIPPSINLILYGLLTNTSVPRLYLAGFLPGFLLAAFFGLIIMITCIVRPAVGGEPVQTTWRQRIRLLPDLLPPVAIFLVVVGSIYAGFATPTEAASIGVVASIILVAIEGKLSVAFFRTVLVGTMRTTAMVMLIILAAQFLNFVLGAIGIAEGVMAALEQLGLGPFGTLLLIVVFYLVLGCFMETISMMILTTPFVVPVIVGLGYDPVWWGIVLTILIEAALITPPVGLNLYVVQGIRPQGSMIDVIIGSLPFVAAMFAMILLLIALPDIALWLPRLMMG